MYTNVKHVTIVLIRLSERWKYKLKKDCWSRIERQNDEQQQTIRSTNKRLRWFCDNFTSHYYPFIFKPII